LSMLRNDTPDCSVHHRTVSGAPSDSVRCTRTVQLKPATLGFLQARSAIIHRTVRCATGQSGESAGNDYLSATVDSNA
jgi:hypothetical protein